MKKKIHTTLHAIKFHCISCDQEYKTLSISQQDIKVEICSNCHPIYTGKASTEIKRGQVERFRHRQEKTNQKTEKREEI